MKFVLILIIVFFSVQVKSQSIFEELASPAGGKIVINQNSSVSSIISSHVDLNKKLKGQPGYRIQIYFGSGHTAKDEAMRIRKSFRNKYPELETYLIYQTPNFKVRAGDFKNRYQAYIAFQAISQNYPSSFLVEDLINSQ